MFFDFFCLQATLPFVSCLLVLLKSNLKGFFFFFLTFVGYWWRFGVCCVTSLWWWWYSRLPLLPLQREATKWVSRKHKRRGVVVQRDCTFSLRVFRTATGAFMPSLLSFQFSELRPFPKITQRTATQHICIVGHSTSTRNSLKVRTVVC